MEEIVYLSVRIICFVYLIFKLWNTRKYVDETCRFLYDKLSSHKSGEKTNVPVLSGDSDADVIGETRFVVLDGNSSLMVAPSTPLESNYIGEEEDVDGDEVECSLPLEKMSLLREEQKELDKSSPAVESIPQQIMSLSDLSNMGDVLFDVGDSRHDEEKLLRAACTLYAIRETDMFAVISSQVHNKEFIGNLINRFLNEDGSPRDLSMKKNKQVNENWRIVL
ncbi:DUF4122 family protein [Phocaeicola vulgatus]|uniref:DUF4122 family protein n=1 Tax=Phocaeicola vulgatus TaxID=821 RepID=UPI00189E06F6|nr:DUF4122 family protein [Phocaeicola vulgatus]